MTIIDLQRGIAEAGRIRIGQQVPTSGGRTRPEKLGTFRLTSSDRRRIEEAAVLFGGEVRPWEAPAGRQWEVITEAAEMDVIVPPQAMAFSQHYELWSAGGCQRRCDGQTEHLSQQPCLCDPDERECDIHTRLSLMIRDLPGLALWRLDTQGWYAARELAGAVEVIAMAAGRGIMIPARLLLEQRSVKRPGRDGKPQTLRFAVPRLDPGITPGQLLLGGGAPDQEPVAALAEGDAPVRRLTPVAQPAVLVPSIAEQSAPPPAPPARRNAAPEIPSSGRRRATPAKAAGEDGYWRARVFAEAAERGLGQDQVREIAAGVKNAHPESFSMSSLAEAEWELVHRVLPGFAGRAPESAPQPQPQAAPATGPDVADTDSGTPDPDAQRGSTGPTLTDEEAEAVWRAVDGQEAPAPAPSALTSEAFTAWLDEHRIDTEYARGIAALLFPGVKRLSDEQRAVLRDELAKGGAA